ncbi:hypothetical protein GOP47_0010368 [Adiantum capillus-veneris]|uniref:Uncharacterized protein n=1 Tax=Adiantum capillus-veneris TaxID=13818 RepID=A0A9D4ZHQ0_ADICA|nr:hypothetical protein GOP47_0010368 [Adiantum capillus-veneris]
MAEAAVCVPSAWSSSGLLSLQSQSLETTLRQPSIGSNRTSLRIHCATQAAGLQPGGTRIIGGKRVKVLQIGDKSGKMRDKIIGEPAAVKLLSRVQQLRLLSKAEKAGLLSAAEKAGLSLSTIERLGLLSKAEGGPAFVYFVPEDAIWQIVVQFAVAFISVLGGSAAFAASNFVSTLQKSD